MSKAKQKTSPSAEAIEQPLPEAIERLRAENEALAQEVEELKARLKAAGSAAAGHYAGLKPTTEMPDGAFLIEPDDPFFQASIRLYNRIHKTADVKSQKVLRGLVLTAQDKAACAVLADYIVRLAGIDPAKAKEIEAVLAEFKK